MKTIIIGGGIAGLTTAIALEQQGIDTHVYEAQSSLGVAGAGIWMATNAMQVFERLGLADDIKQRGMPLDKIEIADYRLKTIQATSQLLFVEAYGFSVTSILRSRLRDTLVEHYGKPVHTAKRLDRVLDNGQSVKAFFTDGSHVSGEILIGADGIHSAVRQELFPKSQIRYSGQTCWRGIADIALEAPYERACVETWGKKYRFGLSVISDKEVYWFAVAKAPRGEKDDRSFIKEKLQSMYAEFSEPIPSILSATPSHRIIRNDITDLLPIRDWHKGRICLIGDAAHATTPNMGQGGGQAVEDAWFLSRVLGEEKDYRLAFQQFQKKRQKKVTQVVKTSWQIGKVAHLSFGQGLRNFLLRNTPKSIAEKRMLDLYSIDY
ncbi:MAG: FAD-dependent monooxygenase [Saprospiraceae bacterium]|nr:FAD-dependent monooxygenase [Saprospiraceae bacterium]